MATTILLTAVPATLARNASGEDATTIIAPFGQKLGLSLISVITTDDIRAEVNRFAQQVHLQFPEASFSVTIRIRAGEDIPPGFDAARAAGTLGQHAFVRAHPDEPTLEPAIGEDEEGT